MINDLMLANAGSTVVQTQVCIVGGGTGGLFLARELRQLGVRVLVVETGDKVARTADAVGQSCSQRGMRYRGAESGRSFGLGGTSALWGGQLIPLAPSDMAARQSVGFEPWPISYSEVAAHFEKVRSQLGLPWVPDGTERRIARRSFPLLSEFGPDFDLRLSEWLPFQKRNFYKAFSQLLEADAELVVWLNAAVVGLSHSPLGDSYCISSVEARSANGRTLIVNAHAVVLCAGALESTRLLLMLDEDSLGLMSQQGSPLGRYFSDHLSVNCGQFECRNWSRYNLETAPIFVNGIMRTPRLELSDSTQRQLNVSSAFAHFTFATHGDSGFDVVRNLLRRRQGELQTLGLSPRALGRVVSDVAAMSYWRVVHRRLWIPRKAELLLQVDIEQAANWNSSLSLSEERDALGRKRLVIDWRITPEDVHAIRMAAERTIEAWRSSPLRDTAELRLNALDNFDKFESLYDVYHPTGTLRMGTSARNSVVDHNLRTWAFGNCYVSSTAVFPSAGSANPGLTHLALTARLALHLRRILTQ